MIFRMLLIFIIGHLLSDFAFQGENIINLRFNTDGYKRLIGNLKHIVVHLVTIIILYILFFTRVQYPIGLFICSTLLILLNHFIIDVIKSEIKTSNMNNRVWAFVIDQALHILFIILIFSHYRLDSISEAITITVRDFPNNFDTLDKWLVGLIIVLINIFVVGIFIRTIFEKNNRFIAHKQILKDNESKDEHDDLEGMKHGGLFIGYMERLFIMSVVSIGQPSMIGFVLATKTIVRYKKLDKDVFAEYFIIGTFMSFIFALIGGILIYKLNIIPIIK